MLTKDRFRPQERTSVEDLSACFDAVAAVFVENGVSQALAVAFHVAPSNELDGEAPADALAEGRCDEVVELT